VPGQRIPRLSAAPPPHNRPARIRSATSVAAFLGLSAAAAISPSSSSPMMSFAARRDIFAIRASLFVVIPGNSRRRRSRYSTRTKAT
jgi:hypothetical protein